MNRRGLLLAILPSVAMAQENLKEGWKSVQGKIAQYNYYEVGPCLKYILDLTDCARTKDPFLTITNGSETISFTAQEVWDAIQDKPRIILDEGDPLPLSSTGTERAQK